jgi:hypothetical protein
MAVLQFFGAACWIAGGLGVMGAATWVKPETVGGSAALGIIAVIALAIGLLQLACGIGLWTLKPYGRTIQLVFAWIGLIGFPFGTVISILLLIYLMKPGVKVLFSGKPAADATAEEHAQVAAAAKSQTAIIVGIAVLFAACFLVLPMAAIAVPALLRARISGNEAGAIASLRAVQSSELAHAALYSGAYATIECLITPSTCHPGSTDPSMLPANFSAESRAGYRFDLAIEPGSFAYIATPEVFGTTGTRSYCADASGEVCQTSTARITVSGGRCPAPPECDPVR